MLKKEFLDVSKRFIECFLVLTVAPVAYIGDRIFTRMEWKFIDYFQLSLTAMTIVFSIYSGATLFHEEKKNRAFEYLFSLPVSRLKILLNKMIPRLVFIAILAVVLIFGLQHPLHVGLIMVILFFISSFFSIPIDSIIIGLIAVIPFYYMYVLGASMLFSLESIAWRKGIIWYMPTSPLPSRFICAILILLPLGISFWKTFKKLDLKPLKFQLKAYYCIALPSVILLTTLMVLYFGVYLKEILNR